MGIKHLIKWKICRSFFRILPYRNVILFESFMGNKVACNPFAIYNILESDDTYKFVWVVNRNFEFENENVIKVKKNSIQYLYYISIAKYLVINGRILNSFKKRKKQKVIQTWHGTPLKKLVHDMQSFKMGRGSKEKYLSNFDEEVKSWDYLLAPNEYSAKIFKSAFKYGGQLIITGYPRNISLYKKDKSNFLDLPKGKKIYLYTPTFRDDIKDINGNYIYDLNFDFEKFSKECSGILLVRTHYLISQNLGLNDYDNIIDVSQIDDINKLYQTADILITDYSSTMFDYNILDKPIVIYAPDLLEYEKELRGFYFDIKTLTKNIAYNTKEVIEILNSDPKNDFKFKKDEKCDISLIKKIFLKENK